MRKVYDMVVKARTYRDAQGQERAEWLNIGSVMEGDNGMFAMLKPHINLAGIPRAEGKDVLASFFEPNSDRQQGGGRQEQRGGGRGNVDLDDSIPFAACWEV
jgi:hypothetical protein